MKEKQVQVGEYTIKQVYNGHVHIYQDGKMICHSSCNKELTEEQLKNELKIMQYLMEHVGGTQACDK